MTRPQVLAAILVLVLGWIVARTWLMPPELPAGAPGQDVAAGSRGKAKVLVAEDVPVVVAGLARLRGGEVFERERSLFEFARSPEEIRAEEEARRQAEEEARRIAEEARAAAAKAAEELARRAEEERKRQEEERKRQEEALRLNPPPPVPPSFQYQYLGVVGQMSDPLAILLGPDRKYRYVRAGEVIDDRFRLEFIGEVRLDLSYTDARFANVFTQVQRNQDSSTRTR